VCWLGFCLLAVYPGTEAAVSVLVGILSACCVSRYSCTEGKTWENYTLPLGGRRIKADGLLNEPGITTLITR